MDERVPVLEWGLVLKERGQRVEAGGLFLLQQPPHSALVWAEELKRLPVLRLARGSGPVQATGLQAAFLSSETMLPAHLELKRPERKMKTWHRYMSKINGAQQEMQCSRAYLRAENRRHETTRFVHFSNVH